ncbi:MAG: YdcF family protein [Bacteroidota bacterium]
MKCQPFSPQAYLSYALFLLIGCDSVKAQNTEQEKFAGPYDVIIVPGVPYKDKSLEIILKARILWAKYLFDNGIAKNILFSGGAVYNPFIEGKIMKIYGEALHIPSENMFSETEAEHSTENIYYSLIMAKQMGFKKIAVATDQYQAIIIKKFMKKNCPDIEVIPIQYSKINLITAPWPEIDPSPACVDDFVSLVERENRVKRFKGTLGKNINYADNDELTSQKKKLSLAQTAINIIPNSIVQPVHTFLNDLKEPSR